MNYKPFLPQPVFIIESVGAERYFRSQPIELLIQCRFPGPAWDLFNQSIKRWSPRIYIFHGLSNWFLDIWVARRVALLGKNEPFLVACFGLEMAMWNPASSTLVVNIKCDLRAISSQHHSSCWTIIHSALSIYCVRHYDSGEKPKHEIDVVFAAEELSAQQSIMWWSKLRITGLSRIGLFFLCYLVL